MRKFFFTAIAASMLLSSCNNVFYQVYNTKSTNLVENDNFLVYENEDCKVIYNLWAKGGNIGFVVKNKTDKDLFLIMPQTFFIKNGVSFDYYQDREYHRTESVAATSGAALSSGIYNPWRDIYSSLATNGTKQRGASKSVVIKEKSMVCIPPNASKEINEYLISDSHIRNCDKKQEYPRRKSNSVTYSKDDSPLVFKNRIAYTFDSTGKNLNYIDNEFWVSELINYSRKEAVTKKKYQECESDVKVERYVFKIGAPNKFYSSYRKNAN